MIKTMNIRNKGFALTQIILAMAIGAIVSVGIVSLFRTQNIVEGSKMDASLILKANQQSQINQSASISTKTKDISITSLNGHSTISSQKCSQIQGEMKSYGGVVSACDNKGTFTYSASNVAAIKPIVNNAISAGVPDGFKPDQVTNAILSGNVALNNVTIVNTGVGNSTFASKSTNGAGSTVLSGGSGSSNINGVPIGPPPSSCSAGPAYIGSSGSYSNPYLKSMSAGISSWQLPSTGSSCGFAQAHGKFTLTYLGQSTPVSVSCKGVDPVNHLVTDFCESTTTINFRGGVFEVYITGSSRFREDVAMPGLCPAYAKMSVSQIAKAPGC